MKSSDNGRWLARNNRMNPRRVGSVPRDDDAGPSKDPASSRLVVSDQDGEADSLGISDAAPDSDGATVSVPGELALPDGEQAMSAAPNASSKTIFFSMWSPPGEAVRRESTDTGGHLRGRRNRTGDGASGVPAAPCGVVAGGSHSGVVPARPGRGPL